MQFHSFEIEAASLTAKGKLSLFGGRDYPSPLHILTTGQETTLVRCSNSYCWLYKRGTAFVSEQDLFHIKNNVLLLLTVLWTRIHSEWP